MMSHICERQMFLIALFYIKMRRISVCDASHQETTTLPPWSNQFMVSGQSNSSKHNSRIYNQRRIDCHFDSVYIEFIYANKQSIQLAFNWVEICKYKTIIPLHVFFLWNQNLNSKPVFWNSELTTQINWNIGMLILLFLTWLTF